LYKSGSEGKEDKTMPIAEYVSLAYELPPNGPVTVRRSVKFKEEDIKGSDGATKIELEGFETTEISFSIDLVTDEDGAAIEKFSTLNKAFRAMDGNDRPVVYSLRYPLTDEAGISLVFISRIEGNDTAGEDHIVVNFTLKELITTRASGLVNEEGTPSDADQSKGGDSKKMKEDALGSGGAGA
jgi:hypothetical protein